MVKAGTAPAILCADQRGFSVQGGTIIISGFRPSGGAVIQPLAAGGDWLLLHAHGDFFRRESLQKGTKLRIKIAVVEHGLAHEAGCVAQHSRIIKCNNRHLRLRPTQVGAQYFGVNPQTLIQLRWREEAMAASTTF